MDKHLLRRLSTIELAQNVDTQTIKLTISQYKLTN